MHIVVMRAITTEIEVSDPVICSIPIDVVHDLSRSKRTTDHLLDDQHVL